MAHDPAHRQPDDQPDDREIDRSDALVEGVLGRGVDASAAAADGDDEAVRRVRALAGEELPTSTRDRHLATIRTHPPAPAPARTRRAVAGPRVARRRLVAVTSATALLLVSGGGAVAAAQGAQPDDALYGLKRTSEQVWLVVPRGPERVADVHLALAERRIDEARRSPDHAAQLVAEGVENVEAAAEERPEAAIESFERLLGDGPDRLPDQASPRARVALHRNCVRIAERRGLDVARCGEAPPDEHPGRGQGRGQGVGPGGAGGPGQGAGRGQGQGGGRAQESGDARGEGRGQGQGLGRAEKDGPRGWGPGGRPDGAVGPPPGTPGHGRGGGDGDAPEDDATE